MTNAAGKTLHITFIHGTRRSKEGKERVFNWQNDLNERRYKTFHSQPQKHPNKIISLSSDFLKITPADYVALELDPCSGTDRTVMKKNKQYLLLTLCLFLRLLYFQCQVPLLCSLNTIHCNSITPPSLVYSKITVFYNYNLKKYL